MTSPDFVLETKAKLGEDGVGGYGFGRLCIQVQNATLFHPNWSRWRWVCKEAESSEGREARPDAGASRRAAAELAAQAAAQHQVQSIEETDTPAVTNKKVIENLKLQSKIFDLEESTGRDAIEIAFAVMADMPIPGLVLSEVSKF